MNVKQLIVRIIRDNYNQTIHDYRKAEADLAGLKASSTVWGEFNTDDGVGGMSANPYSTQSAQNKVNNLKERMNDLKKAYEYAVDTFLEN